MHLHIHVCLKTFAYLCRSMSRYIDVIYIFFYLRTYWNFCNYAIMFDCPFQTWSMICKHILYIYTYMDMQVGLRCLCDLFTFFCFELFSTRMYIHTCMHAYMHTYIQTNKHTHTYTYIHIHIHTHTYTYIHIHTHTCTYIHIHTHTYTYTYIHIHTHTYTHIHTYIHTHTYTQKYRLTNIHTHTHTFTYMHTCIHACICA